MKLLFYISNLLNLFKHIFAYTTDRAAPVIRQCLKGSAGSNTTVRIALFRIIDIPARAALIFGRFIRGYGFFSSFLCLPDQTGDQRRNPCQIILLRIPLWPNVFVNHIKTSLGQFCLQELDALTAPAIAAEGRGLFVLKLELFQEFHPTSYAGKNAV